MARLERFAGETISINVDLTDIHGYSQIIIEVYFEQFKRTTFQYAYPAMTGYRTLSVDGDNATLTLNRDDTNTMNGDYGIKLTYTLAGETHKGIIEKNVDLDGITINK